MNQTDSCTRTRGTFGIGEESGCAKLCALGLIQRVEKIIRGCALTYDSWNCKFLLPAVMARAGFVYLGYSDAVRCVYCGNCLETWVRNDKPLLEHLRHFPDCEFMKAVFEKGKTEAEFLFEKTNY
uniref:Uncharacterized protein n=1 Tax=Strigamia maritima TaxID=126957 RepID=T1IJ41_STRMM